MNRGMLSALDAGEQFAVTGRFVTDDGSVWYQLNKEEVLPNSAANEIWVTSQTNGTNGLFDQLGAIPYGRCLF